MAVENIKSTAIIALDTIPPFPSTTGEGSSGYERVLDGIAAVAAASSATSTYRIARLPSNAKLKSLGIFTDAAPGAGAVSVGASYSDSTVDGTNAALQGTLISATAFGTTLTLAATANTRVDALTTLAVGKRLQPLWQALGLTADPGGFIDILVTVTTAITNATNLYVAANYVD